MTDTPDIPPAIQWSNSFSMAFCTLLSICAAAKVVVSEGGTIKTRSDGNSAARAKRLLTRELVARLATGSWRLSADYDQLLTTGDQYGVSIADEFAARGTASPYRAIGGGPVLSSVPRQGKPPEFVQNAAVGAYFAELDAVLAACLQLSTDVASQAAKNTAIDSTVASVTASALAAARAAYVTQLQVAYPGRGYT